MIRVHHTDKQLVLDILCSSFDHNNSVNHVVKQDKKREQRMRHLMDYSFEICRMFGDIFLSDDKKACALVLFPDKKKTSLKTIVLDLKMAIHCVGISRVLEILNRNSRIKKSYPKNPICYLWFIGVLPAERKKGIGSDLLGEVIRVADSLKRPIYLETSIRENLPFYRKFGFTVYNELEFGYKLFLVKKE